MLILTSECNWSLPRTQGILEHPERKPIQVGDIFKGHPHEQQFVIHASESRGHRKNAW